MARVALCPQCSIEVLLADDMDTGAWAKCPECRAFFQIEEAAVREISPALRIDDDASDASEVSQSAGETAWLPLDTELADSRVTFSDSSAQTISDIESTAATKQHNGDTFDMPDSGLTEPTNEATSDTYVEPDRSPTTVTDVAGLATWTSVSQGASDEHTSVEPPDRSRAQTTLIHSLPVETPPLDTPTGQRLEDSAERIDKWFRTAKSKVEVPSTAGASQFDTPAKPADVQSAAPATIETPPTLASAPQLAESKPEIKLDDRPVLPDKDATWEDSERMERLLADIEVEPAGESTPEAQHETMARTDDQSKSTPQWSTEISPTLSMGSGKPRRKKSALRSIAMSAVAGMMGLALGYYVLLWIAGTGADFFDVAQYLPAAILPGEFQSPTAQLAATSSPPAAPANDQPEVQASFNEPAAPQTDSIAGDDQTALPADTATPAADTQFNEPTQFESQEAAPLTTAPRQAEGAAISNAPTFTADELAVALQAARQAQPGLVTGNLRDSRDIQRAKGYSYSLLGDLAQKAAFVDTASRTDYVAPLQTEADALFRQTLADEHTREEVALIVPKWIASPNRKHGGVFFAATMSGGADKGSVVEYSGDLGAGTTLILLVPPSHASQLMESGRPIGIVGWIVDKPAQQVNGYSGDAQQAIWASRLVPLE